MGDSFDVDIFPKETIDDVKRIIYDLKGIPVESQMLVRLERELRDSLTLTDCGLQDGSSVSLVVKMTGGTDPFFAI